MRRIFLIVVAAIAIIYNVKCDEKEDLNCKSMKTSSPTRRLKDHLFCEYDSSIRPSLNDKPDTTIVNVRLLPQYVEFSEEQNILYLHTWLSMIWPDAHLTWEPSEWENVREIHVKSYEIWRPDLTVFNSGDTSDNNAGIGYTDCLVTFNGTVKCVAPTKYTSHCPTDYSEWPYDKHNCTLQIGAWIFYHEEILIKMDNDSIIMDSFMENKQWNVHIEHGTPEFVGRVHDEGELTIFITVMLQRHGTRLAIIYVLPAVVLMILTLIVLWLDSQSIERIFVACINFICHILGIFDLHWYFPTSGSERTPKILVFYETSVGLAATALILTCLLRKLRNTSVPAPMWLMSGTGIILNSPVGFLLKLNIMELKKDAIMDEDDESNGQISNTTTKDRTWQELSAIIEWFSFIIVFLIYLIMLAIVLPPRAPKDIGVGFWV